MENALYERAIERRGLRSELSAAWAISIRIWKVELSYPLSVLWFIVMPFIFFIPALLAGTAVISGPSSVPLESMTGIDDWVTYIAIGSALNGLILSMFWGTGMSLRRDQNVGTLETLFTTPVSRYTFVWGSALHNLQHGGLGVLLQLIVSVLLLGVTINAWGILPALVFLALGIIGFQGIVFAIASVVLVAKQGWMIVEILGSTFVLLAPLTYPIAVLPVVLQTISMGSPLTWATDAFRNSLVFGLGAPGLIQALFALLVLNVIYLSIGAVLFRRTERWVRGRGVLAQF